MNKLCITLLLIFAVWFGWQRYTEHRAAKARDQREMFEGYERCTASLDEARIANHTDEREWQKARDDCQNFWLASEKK